MDGVLSAAGCSLLTTDTKEKFLSFNKERTTLAIHAISH